jgi:transposase
VAQRTRTINALRGHAAEFGVAAAGGTGRVAELLAAVALADKACPGDGRGWPASHGP